VRKLARKVQNQSFPHQQEGKIEERMGGRKGLREERNKKENVKAAEGDEVKEVKERQNRKVKERKG
jgi:hypothetical protein